MDQGQSASSTSAATDLYSLFLLGLYIEIRAPHIHTYIYLTSIYILYILLTIFLFFRQIILNCITKRYERKSKAMVKFLSEQMPDYVARVTAGSYDTWEAKPGAKVVLFSKKKEAPSALKALSTKYVEMMTHPFWVSLTRGHTNGVR